MSASIPAETPSSSSAAPPVLSAAAADASAAQVAQELLPFVPQNALPLDKPIDLQLAICRKLREVSVLH
jgi:hypothetical protein